jgi:hypothetical protein
MPFSLSQPSESRLGSRLRWSAGRKLTVKTGHWVQLSTYGMEFALSRRPRIPVTYLRRGDLGPRWPPRATWPAATYSRSRERPLGVRLPRNDRTLKFMTVSQSLGANQNGDQPSAPDEAARGKQIPLRNPRDRSQAEHSCKICICWWRAEIPVRRSSASLHRSIT